MISGEIRFEGFDVGSWTNLLSLVVPGVVQPKPAPASPNPASWEAPSAPGTGSAVVVCTKHGDILNVQHSVRGRLDAGPLRIRDTLEESAQALCGQLDANRCLVLREGVMEELAERLALRFNLDEGYGSQWLMLLRAVRELMDADQMALWPNPLAGIPIPSAGTLGRALDLALPSNRTAVVVLWHQREIWTAAAVRRRESGIDLVAGPDLIQRWAGPLGGDWRRDYRVVSDAVARATAPVHVGIFAEAEAFRGLLRSSASGAWATEVAVRNVILNPLPSAYGVALGADALRGVGRVSAQFLGGLDIVHTVLPWAQRVRAQLTEAATIVDVLGFDPLAVLRAWLDGQDTDAEPE